MTTRLPAEWEPHRACWLAWPQLEDEWPGHLDGARGEIAALASQIARLGGERVHLLVDESEAARVAARLGQEIAAKSITLEHIPYGDVWTRDTLPLFSIRGSALVANVFDFDGWGGKYLMPGDAELGQRVATRLDAETHARSLVLEGGALEVNGEGLALTTEDSVFLRNSDRDWAQTEALLLEALDLEKIVILRGSLLGDHTDGHIDTLARFVSATEIVVMRAATGDPNADVLRRIHAQIEYMCEDHGLPFQIHTIPSPGALLSDAGELLPGSYLNFYIANEAVFVPAYGVPSDEEARLALEAFFPGRRVHSSPARHLLTGGGAIHCVTHQEPSLGKDA
jgi:agmatine deiminase